MVFDVYDIDGDSVITVSEAYALVETSSFTPGSGRAKLRRKVRNLLSPSADDKVLKRNFMDSVNKFPAVFFPHFVPS